MSTVIVTGAGGLIGSEAVRHFVKEHRVIGIDNDARASFFGSDASTEWQLRKLKEEFGPKFVRVNLDITDTTGVEALFSGCRNDIVAVVHCAAQPSHDWAAKAPHTDFRVNAHGTLNLLEAVRVFTPNAVFVHLSTNKVYGDRPNYLPLIEKATRFDLPYSDPMFDGVDEQMSIDHTKHSLFGVSKASADLYVQEYGRYFGLKTVALRGGCLTGPAHSGTKLHGFLSYLVKCAVTGETYTIIGYGGKQVRDNIHSADLIEAVDRIVRKPPEPGTVFNIGGGRENSVSILEAIDTVQHILGVEMKVEFNPTPRIGDHKWYITNNRKLMDAYPGWSPKTSVRQTIEEICEAMKVRWGK